MATPLHPHHLRGTLRQALAKGHAIVEYYHNTRDLCTAHTIDKTATWLRRHRPEATVAIYSVDISQDRRRQLDALNVQLLPQPSTVALYGPGGVNTQLYAGSLQSSRELLQQLPRHPGLP